MSPEEAARLVKLLADSHVRKLDPDVAALYANVLVEFGSSTAARAAVADLMYAERFPNLGQLRAAYRLEVGREIEQSEGQERRALEEEIVRSGEGLPPMVTQLMAKMASRSTTIDAPSVLVEVAPGACDDCGKPSEHRYAYGMFKLDALCASKRLAVRVPE